MISLFMEWKFSEDVFLCRDDFLKTLSLPTEEFLVPCSFNAVYRVLCPLMWNIVNCNISWVCYTYTNMLAILVSFMNQILLNTYSHAYFKFKQKYLVISLFLCVFVFLFWFFSCGGGGVLFSCILLKFIKMNCFYWYPLSHSPKNPTKIFFIYIFYSWI